mmetsp:Transcript_107889/g.315416  ORF Transcript_107889/g.315416 Transcript_107889/m.315416 type:complete len:309 (-) Transcript_107889:784-1710(-)
MLQRAAVVAHRLQDEGLIVLQLCAGVPQRRRPQPHSFSHEDPARAKRPPRKVQRVAVPADGAQDHVRVKLHLLVLDELEHPPVHPNHMLQHCSVLDAGHGAWIVAHRQQTELKVLPELGRRMLQRLTILDDGCKNHASCGFQARSQMLQCAALGADCRQRDIHVLQRRAGGPDQRARVAPHGLQDHDRIGLERRVRVAKRGTLTAHSLQHQLLVAQQRRVQQAERRATGANGRQGHLVVASERLAGKLQGLPVVGRGCQHDSLLRSQRLRRVLKRNPTGADCRQHQLLVAASLRAGGGQGPTLPGELL